MKITKFVHSCLLVEMPSPVNRTVLFDPGVMSEAALHIDSLEYLDDIVITHGHADHCSVPLVKHLVGKFPDVRITTTPEVADMLRREGIQHITSEETEGLVFFEAPHENVEPMFAQPQNIGVHYIDMLTDPGDSHSFDATKPILALPIQAPWGSTLDAVRLALKLKPKHILPIHDWHWSDEAREGMYSDLEGIFAKDGITFHRLKTGEPVVIDLA